MAKYKVFISLSVKQDLDAIVEYLKSINTYRAAHSFRKSLIEDIETLKNSAGSYKKSSYQTVQKYHPHAKSITSKNKHWTIIFYIEENVCYVVKILPSQVIY
jgi:hypothetical protein